MKIYKNCESFSFLISTYVVFFIQIMYVYNIEDDLSTEEKQINQVLIVHKFIYCFIFLMTFFTHFVTSFFDPGFITRSNNKQMLEFYESVHKDIIKIKKNYEKFNLIPKEENSSDEENEHSDDENAPNTISNPNESSRIEIINNFDNDIFQKKKKNIQNIPSKKYDFEISRCNTCFVLRPKETQHCSDCQYCVLGRDNHCPWMNNCIGFFNRKFFILFCIYSILAVGYSFLIYFYYVVFKNFRTFRRSFSRSIKGIFFMFFSFIYGGFCLTLLGDERKELLKEFKNYGDEKENLLKLKMRIIFGGNLSLKWFLPCFKGGKRNFNPVETKNKKEKKSKNKKRFKRGSQLSFVEDT